MSMGARVSSLMNDRIRRRHVLLGVALLAVMVAAYTVNTLMLHAYSLVRQETVLDCPYEGSGAHKHDASCYDKHGLLVCPLGERELHEHPVHLRIAVERVDHL